MILVTAHFAFRGNRLPMARVPGVLILIHNNFHKKGISFTVLWCFWPTFIETFISLINMTNALEYRDIIE